ncbi:MAG: nuclear transport factor 2 family protein, partial [Gallionellaceae bacterium]|nr:nuclear transport factor 2 family protein [Gallionellaceae bacterium]
ALAQPYTGGTRVQGKDALRRYWLAALADRPDLRFELISAICDVEAQTVVVHYVAQACGKRTRMCEIMRFENGRQVHGEALHGVPAEEDTP